MKTSGRTFAKVMYCHTRKAYWEAESYLSRLGLMKLLKGRVAADFSLEGGFWSEGNEEPSPGAVGAALGCLKIHIFALLIFLTSFS